MRRMLGRIIVVMFMMALLVAVPVRVEAASKLNCTKWEVTCADKGKTKTLKVTGSKNGKYKHNGKWYTIKWSSSNKNIATVDKNGKVKVVAKKTGSATIKATFKIKDGNVGFTKEIGTCKVTVGHANETTTEYREPSLYAPGGNYELSTCKVCGSKSEKLVGKAVDFQYTEDFVVSEMEKIVEYSSECPLLTTYNDGDDDITVNGFKSHTEFFNYLVEENLYPSVILDLNTKTEATADIKDYGASNGKCESGVHVFEVLLGNNYELIHRGGKKDGFSFYELKAGDIITSREGDHTVIFKEYYKCSNGDILMGTYTGVYGQLLYSEDKVESADAIGVSAFKNASVYRLKNYE